MPDDIGTGADCQRLIVRWSLVPPATAKCSLDQLAVAYREAHESPDIRVTRLGLELLWRQLSGD
jgi:hypothetical protein